MLPKDKQLFAAQLRRRQLQRQLPLHDLHSKFCDSVTEKELQKFLKFAEKRKNKAAGIGNVGSIPDQGIRVCTLLESNHIKTILIAYVICFHHSFNVPANQSKKPQTKKTSSHIIVV